MALITTLVQPVLWQGKAFLFKGAPFLQNVLSIARLSPSGQGWQTRTSSSSVYAFNYLEPGTYYVVESSQVPYEIPEEVPVEIDPSTLALTTDADILPLTW